MYGMPEPELFERAKRGDVVLGCLVTGDGSDPKWECRACGHRFQAT
jgi:hypothetical protein